MPGKPKSVFKFLAYLLFLVCIFWFWNNQQNISDWFRLRKYTPDATISSLVSNSGFNDQGRKLFYINYPTLKDRKNFRSYCTNSEESIVLGCYISTQNIYLLDVTDERLDGVEEVTAAHEMLHAAYARLSPKDKTNLNKLLLEQEKLVTDKRVLETIEAYRKSDAQSVVNEMHSIFGSELKNLTSELEEYYKKYFSDRSKVTAHASSYAEEFTKREALVQSYDVRLADLKTKIDSSEADLKRQADSLESQRSSLESKRNSNSAAEFNQLAAQYNLQVRQYNAALSAVKKLVNDYNQIVTERNNVALEEQTLLDAIDTRVDAL